MMMMHTSNDDDDDDDNRGQRLMLAMREYFLSVVEKNKNLFTRIIDSYRLWSHDDNEYRMTMSNTTTAATTTTGGGGDGGGGGGNKPCVHSLYGLKAQQQQQEQHGQDDNNNCSSDDDDQEEEEEPLLPLKHFRAFLRMGKGVLPDSLIPEKNKISYQALIVMATADDWANIGKTVTPLEMEEHYHRQIEGGGFNSSVESLRLFAISIAGPIHHDGHDGNKDIMEYMSSDDEESDGDEYL
jgi:hypothetical protein